MKTSDTEIRALTIHWPPLAAALFALILGTGPSLGADPVTPYRPPPLGAAAERFGPAVVRATEVQNFVPSDIRVVAGHPVEWKNVSTLRHTVTAVPAKSAYPEHVHLPPGAAPFDSGTLEPGATYRHVFAVPGTYKYFCLHHQSAGMTGTVTVEPQR